MRLDIYLNYRGNCEQAFRFYEEHLHGKITGMIRMGRPIPPAGGLEGQGPPRAHRDRLDGADGRFRSPSRCGAPT